MGSSRAAQVPANVPSSRHCVATVIAWPCSRRTAIPARRIVVNVVATATANLPTLKTVIAAPRTAARAVATTSAKSSSGKAARVVLRIVVPAQLNAAMVLVTKPWAKLVPTAPTTAESVPLHVATASAMPMMKTALPAPSTVVHARVIAAKPTALLAVRTPTFRPASASSTITAAPYSGTTSAPMRQRMTAAQIAVSSRDVATTSVTPTRGKAALNVPRIAASAPVSAARATTHQAAKTSTSPSAFATNTPLAARTSGQRNVPYLLKISVADSVAAYPIA